MALTTIKFNLDINPGLASPIVNVSEYDINRQFIISIMENGKSFEIPSNVTATIEGTLNQRGFQTAGNISNNTVSFTLTEAMTASKGRAWVKIKLVQDNSPISTCGFWLNVDRAGVEAETVIGGDGFDTLVAKGASKYLSSVVPELVNDAVNEYAQEYGLEYGGYYVTPEMYGAKADGETDDSLAIQSAINSGACCVVFPNQYRVDSSVQVTNRDITLKFTDNASLTVNDFTGYAFNFVGCDRIIIDGGRFQREGTLESAAKNKGIARFERCDRIKIVNVRVAKCLSGYAFTASNGCHWFMANNSFFDTCSLGGLTSFNSDGIKMKVTGCEFRNFRAKGEDIWYSYPICISYGSYVDSQNMPVRKTIGELLEVSDCFFENCDWEAIDSHGCKNVSIRNVIMHNCARFITSYMDERVWSDKYNQNLIVENVYAYNDSDYTFPDYGDHIHGGFIFTAMFGRMSNNIAIRNLTAINTVGTEGYPALRITGAKHVTIDNLEMTDQNRFCKTYAIYFNRINHANCNNIRLKGYNNSHGSVLVQLACVDFENCTFDDENDSRPSIMCADLYAVKTKRCFQHGQQTVMYGAEQNLVSSDDLKYGNTRGQVYGFFLTVGTYNGLMPKERAPSFMIDGLTGVSGSKVLTVGSAKYIMPGVVVDVMSGSGTVMTSIVKDIRFEYGQQDEGNIYVYTNTYIELMDSLPSTGDYSLAIHAPFNSVSFAELSDSVVSLTARSGVNTVFNRAIKDYIIQDLSGKNGMFAVFFDNPTDAPVSNSRYAVIISKLSSTSNAAFLLAMLCGSTMNRIYYSYMPNTTESVSLTWTQVASTS